MLRTKVLRPTARVVRETWPCSDLTAKFRGWGLGNQLFQVAGTYAIAARRNVGVALPKEWPFRPFFSVPDEWFAGQLTTRRCTEAWHFAVEIEPAGWRPFLQDLRLWHGTERTIHQALQPSDKAIEAVTAKYGDLLKLESTTAIHVRRGDYLSLKTFHRPCPLAYYDQAVEMVERTEPSTQYLIFSDDIAWCRRNLPIRDAIYVSGNADWLDLAFMSRCDQHICANSTFSWWGAFLSGNPSPITPWLTGVFPENFRRIVPAGWREIEVPPDPMPTSPVSTGSL